MRPARRANSNGGNLTAARYSGVNTKRIKLTVLLISSLTAAIAGMLYAGRLSPAASSSARATRFR